MVRETNCEHFARSCESRSKRLFSNYRPVCVLPIFSKFLEKTTYIRLINYIDKHKLLANNQYGFRKNHSTSLALLHLHDKISSAVDERKYTAGLFLDLSKAFDTVNHSILLGKLEHYGIRGLTLEWVKSSLCNRLQYVEFNGISSSYKEILCGVPQGSVPGPLFFLIYINHICHLSNLYDLVLFADDTNLFFSHNDIQTLTHTINSEMLELSDWFKANKLSLNVKKSNYVIFKARQRREEFDLNIEINGHKMTRVKEVTFLGVILDENLSWKPHISHIACKISESIGMIGRSSPCLTKLALKTLYYSLVYPYFQYCIIVWGSTYPTNLNRLILL